MAEPLISIVLVFKDGDKFLEETLESIKKQKYKHLEILLLNTSSIPLNEDTIYEYIRDDKRFKYYEIKEDCPKNWAITKAKGQYIIFASLKEVFLPKAFTKIKNKGATGKYPILISMKEEDIYGNISLLSSSKTLASRKKIDKHRREFLYSNSISNMAFSTKFLRENNIRFRGDAHIFNYLFKLEALNKANAFGNIKFSTVRAIKHPFWEDAITNYETKKSLEEIEIIDNIIYTGKEIAKASQAETSSYLSDLVYKIVEVDLINKYFLHPWNYSQEVLDRASKKYYDLVGYLRKEQIEKLEKKHSEIFHKAGLKPRDELRRNPKISVLIRGRFNKNNISLILESIYRQNFPSFQILLDEGYREVLEDRYLKKDNMVFVEPIDNKMTFRRLLDFASGTFVLPIKHFTCYSKKSFRVMEKGLRDNQSADFISILPKIYFENKLEDLAQVGAAFGYRRKTMSSREDINVHDYFIGNKLIKKEKYEEIIEKFGESHRGGLLYKNLNFIKSRATFVVVNINDKLMDISFSSTADLTKAFFLSVRNRIMYKAKMKAVETFSRKK